MRPRLLLVTPCYPPAQGGIEHTAGRLAALLDGVDLAVVASRSARAGVVPMRPGSVLRLTRNQPPGGRKAALRLNARAGEVALRWRPDLVLATEIRAMPSARFAARAAGARAMVIVHAGEMGERPRLAAAAVAWADKVVAVSSYSRELALASGARAEQISVIHPGVDVPTREALPASERPWPRTIVTVARLDDRYKGHDVLIEALPRVRRALPDVRWNIVGDGRLRPELERRVEHAGVSDAVSFLGAVSDAERDAQLASAHVFCMPSRQPAAGIGEGFGIAYVEAGASRLPVIAGRVPGVVDAVIDGRTGVLVDPTDPRELAGALVALLDDAERMDALGAAGASHAATLAWPHVAKRYRRAVQDALCGAPLARAAAGLGWVTDALSPPRSREP